MNPILARSFATLIAVGAALSVHAQPPGGWRHEHRRVPTVTLYEHADFRGASLTLEMGQRIPNLDWARFDNGSRINDRISSIRIEGPVELVAFEHAEFSGRALVTAGDIRNLDWIQGRWNDAISSLRVRPIGARDRR